MPGLKSPERFTPNKKDLKISDVRTRDEKTVDLLQEGKKVREEMKGADKSFAERRSASDRFEAVAGLEDDFNQVEKDILKVVADEVVQKMDKFEDEIINKSNPGKLEISLNEILAKAISKVDAKVLPLEVKEKIEKGARKLKNTLIKKRDTYEKFTEAEEGSAEEAIYAKMLEKYVNEIDKLTSIAA